VLFEVVERNRASVLVVDDNPLVSGVLKSLLASENYNVLTSENGREALATLAEKPVDLIICDVMMPEMGGYELHRAVREDRRLAHVPFIFLTALEDPAEVELGQQSGADDYLVKPFDPRQILSIVKGKLARSDGLRSATESRFEEYRRRVVHTLSHEFRTPLVAINTGAELLIDRHGAMPEDKVRRLLEAIYRGGQRLERLVTDFMLLQQIEAGVSQRLFDSRSTVHTLSDVLERVCVALSEHVTGLGHTIECVERSAGARVKLYEPQFQEALLRLVDNAAKFSPEEKLIEVVSHVVSGDAWVEVRDRGIGMDLGATPDAGAPFGQVNRDKLEQQGSGFGLAIAKRFAVIHGGRINIAPREGGGSVVTLVLPVFEPGKGG